MRAVFTRCIVAGLGLCAGAILGEVMLRALRLAPTNGLATVSAAQFLAVPGMLAPHQDFVDSRDRRLPHHVTTNALGYRGSEFPLEKPPGEFRVFLTGDSFAYGDFVDDDATLPAQLAQRLAGRCIHVRVINAGLDAGTIVDEAQIIRRGLAVSPDLVVLLFSENDVIDLRERSTWSMLADNRRAKAELPLSVLYPVLRRTALWNFAQQVRAASWSHEVKTVKADWFGAESDVDSLTARLRQVYRGDLLALRDTLRARRVPFALAAYPMHFAITRPEKRGQLEWLSETSTAAGITMINLLAPLFRSGLPLDSLYLLPYDGHPSPQGYAVAASYLADRLVSEGLVPGGCNAALR